MDLLVNRDEMRETRIDEPVPSALEAGQARLKVERFGLSANNITYAVIGDMLQYWDFFPAPDGWGRVPVWGYGAIVETSSDQVQVGQRVFGYFPMSSELVVDIGRVDQYAFTDAAAHRAAMADAYNRYRFVEPADSADPVDEQQRMLLQPLFFTSFLVDDFLADNDQFGAGTVIISSASSKTALGLARLAAKRDGVSVVGLTSPVNQTFVEGLDVYDRVVLYGNEAELPDGKAAYVDVSGSAAVRAAVHDRYRSDLMHDMILGGTHHTESGGPADLPGPAPEFFFAPSQMSKRSGDWGASVLDTKMEAAWADHALWVADWMSFECRHGAAELTRTWTDLFDNRVDPSTGFVMTLASKA